MRILVTGGAGYVGSVSVEHLTGAGHELVVLDRSRLAVRGDDLMAELGLPPGPRLGRILDELLERVIAEPRLNDRATLLLLAESMLADDR